MQTFAAVLAIATLIVAAAATTRVVDPADVALQRPLVGPPLTDARVTSRNGLPGPWGADLAVPLVIPRPRPTAPNRTTTAMADVLHVFGDVECLCDRFPRTPNAQCLVPSNAPTVHNNHSFLPFAGAPETCRTDPATNFPRPVHRLLAPIGSTVPGGLLLLPAAAAGNRTVPARRVALFMMNVSTWGNHTDGTIEANGFLVEQTVPATTLVDRSDGGLGPALHGGATTARVEPAPYLAGDADAPVAWSFPTNGPFVNAAPAFAVAPGATPDEDCNRVLASAACARQAVYVYYSKAFRYSPIYLARVPSFDHLFDASSYKYLSARPAASPADVATAGQSWSSVPGHAVPVVPADVATGVGELGVTYLRCYQAYVLSYFAFGTQATPAQHGENAWVLKKSTTGPAGPFTDTLQLMNRTTRFPWEVDGWGGPYGGYVYQTPELAGGSVVRLVLSLLKPYAAGDVTLDLAKYWGPCRQ